MGAVITPLLITPVAIRYGWRWAFVMTAVLGALWMAMWLVLRARQGLYKAHPHFEEHKERSKRLAAEGRQHGRWNTNLFASVAIYGLGAAPLAALDCMLLRCTCSYVLHVHRRCGWDICFAAAGKGWGERDIYSWGWLEDRRHHGDARRPVGVFCGLAAAGLIGTLLPLAASTPWPVAGTRALCVAEMFGCRRVCGD